MQYLTLALTTLVSMAAAQDPTYNVMFRFSEYGNGDTTCDPANLISPSVSINGPDVGASQQFPVGTVSHQIEGVKTLADLLLI